MYYWTFFLLIGKERRLLIDQVVAGDLRSAYLEWAKVVEIEDVWISAKGRSTAWGMAPNPESDYAIRSDLKNVWCSICTFDIADGDIPDEWGGQYPNVWVIKTDV